MNRRSVLIAPLGAAALLAGCSTSGLSPDYPAYSSVEELFSAADLVVRGTALRHTTQIIGPRRKLGPSEDPRRDPGQPRGGALPYQVFDIEVAEVFRGTVAGPCQVKKLGGSLNGVEHVEKEARMLVVRQEYVLFLAVYDDAPASILGGTQGQYRVVGDQLVSEAADGLQLPMTLAEARSLKGR